MANCLKFADQSELVNYNITMHVCNQPMMYIFLGFQASMTAYNRSLVEKSGVARALVEVSYYCII